VIGTREEGEPAHPVVHRPGRGDTHAAVSLTAEPAQHGVALHGGKACVDRAVIDYPIDLRTPQQDTRSGG
jgi:hypothetical protein